MLEITPPIADDALLEQALEGGHRFLGGVLVVLDDELERATVDTARRIDVVHSELGAVANLQTPGREVGRDRGEDADLDRLTSRRLRRGARLRRSRGLRYRFGRRRRRGRLWFRRRWRSLRGRGRGRRRR